MEDTLRVPPPILLIVKSLVLVVLISTCPKSQLVGVTLMAGLVGNSDKCNTILGKLVFNVPVPVGGVLS